ncbi:hypothetical protein Tco_0488711 [Tanacetum coccineum]
MLTECGDGVTSIKRHCRDLSSYGVRELMTMYVVPTGRVQVPTGRYVVPTGKDNLIVSAGRPNMVLLKVIQNGNSLKRTGRDRDGRVIILPPTTADEHIAVQEESKARTYLASSMIPEDHSGDFH